MEPQLYRCGNVVAAGNDGPRVLLQWSRNFIVAEIRPRPRRCPSPRPASMEPQLYRCGNNVVSKLSVTVSCMLQWSRNFIVAEIMRRNWYLGYSARLQWSRNFIVAEILVNAINASLFAVASMEPQLYRCGNVHVLGLLVVADVRFNGAATLSLRKYDA